LRALEALLPSLPPAGGPLPELTPARGKRRGRVGLLTGCVQGVFFPHVNRETARLLAAAGWEVVAPRGQGCCGALHLHAGRLDEFRAQASALMRAFPPDLDFVVVNAAGCGSAMKEYGHWLEAAGEFAGKVRDISEVLAEAVLPLRELPLTVTYHDACHLAHGQRVRAEPRALLRRIPGLRVVELAESEVCCGSAGVYNILEPEVAGELGRRKVQRIRETGARVVVTGNPGCITQIAGEARRDGLALEVLHPVELLGRALADEREGSA
jgi:glycolate oxidase iron-sulfur subunit